LALVKTVSPPARELCFECFEASETGLFLASLFTAVLGTLLCLRGVFWSPLGYPWRHFGVPWDSYFAEWFLGTFWVPKRSIWGTPPQAGKGNHFEQMASRAEGNLLICHHDSWYHDSWYHDSWYHDSGMYWYHDSWYHDSWRHDSWYHDSGTSIHWFIDSWFHVSIDSLLHRFIDIWYLDAWLMMY